MDELGAQRERMHAEVEQLRGADERLQRLAGEIDKAAAAWRVQAEVLTASRRNADRKSTRLNSSHSQISYAVFCLKKKKTSTLDFEQEVNLLEDQVRERVAAL